MRELADYWLTGFDWRQIELEINRCPNFVANIDGVNIHYIHIKAPGQKSIPIIITHGWPGSFLEMMKLIQPLTQSDSGISFDLIVPSMPGFGFSDKITKPGGNLFFIASIWNSLMKTLGYKKYIAQGGDFGAGVSTALALKYPENVMGIHLNYIPGSYFPFINSVDAFTEEEKDHLRYVDQWYSNEGAYAHQHRTRPLTLAYSLNDSPVGLCAWIVEKFFYWSDCNMQIESVFSKDDLLANVSLYWFTETIHSIRLYNENSKVPLRFSKDDFVKVPVGIAHFKKEAPFPPRLFIERGYNLQHWSDFDSGGHFAAMENPSTLAKDIISFAKKLESR
jgi:pimeloyl-ACP methyl ester carboxylesterase